MNLWKLSWRNAWARPARTLLTVLSIAIGVSAVIAVLEATAMTRHRVAEVRGAVASRVAIEVAPTEKDTFAEETLDIVRETPGVKTALASLRRFTIVYANGKKLQGPIVGVDIEQYRAFRDFELIGQQGSGGQSSESEDSEEEQVVLEETLAAGLEVKPGDSVRLLNRRSLRPATRQVSAVLVGRGIGAIESAGSAFIPLEDAQWLWRREGEVSLIEVVLDKDGDAERVAAKLRQRLPASLAVRRVTAPADLGEETRLLVTQSMNMAAALSLVAALFIILNTFLMSVAERQRQFAVLRIVGATPGQIRWLILQEAVLLSLVGAAVGVAVGLGGGYMLSSGMQALFDVDLAIPLTVAPIVAGAAFGPLITLAAAVYPMKRAAETPPLAILKAGLPAGRAWRLRGLTVAGLCGLVVAAVMLTAALLEWVFIEVSILALSLGVFCCVLVIPALLRPIAYAMHRLLFRWFPVESILAHRELVRHATRSTLTIGVLFVVMCTGIGVGNTIIDVNDDVMSWFERTITADYYVRATVPRLDASTGSAVPDELEAELEAIPGVAGVDRVAFLAAEVNGQPATLIVREFSRYDLPPLDLQAGDRSRLREDLLAGKAVSGSVLMSQVGAKVGDGVTVKVRGVQRKIPIVGVIGEYTAGGSVLVMDRQAAQRLFSIHETHVYVIEAAPGAAKQIEPALAELTQQHGLILQSLAEFRELVRGMVTGITSSLWVLLVLGLVIAVFGIVNTLSMNVLEQTRSLGLLRVVGMTQMQVRGMVFCEALMIAVLALAPGAVGGVVLALLITLSFRGLYGHAIEFRPDPLLVFGSSATALVLVIAAAFFPAQRAAKLNPLAAIHEE